jgi:hypothetical protein
MTWCILYIMLSKTNSGYLLNQTKYHFMHEKCDMSYFYNHCLENIHVLFIGLLDNVICDVILFMM